MQIVIDIPESIYNTIIDDEMISREQLAVLQMHILNGTPLPKGHGDLIDIEELKDMLCLEDNDYNRDNNVAELITLEDMDRLDVVIEADKE